MRVNAIRFVSRSSGSLFTDYIQLTKPRIVALLIFTTLTAMVVANKGQPLPVDKLLGTLLGGILAAAGASAINQYLDRDIDAQMARTKLRPIPSGRIAPFDALLFGLGLLIWAMLVLGLLVNWFAAILALMGAAYYVLIYTLLLKRNTALNIIIGGGAGAIPVLVGWVAVNQQLSLEPIILFAIIFFWTPPHSWALALLVNSDYQKATVPMMPALYGAELTRWQILLYSVHLVLLTLLPVPLGMFGTLYLVAAALLGTGLLVESVRLIRAADKAAARRLYKYSSMYLALLFLAMMLDRIVT